MIIWLERMRDYLFPTQAQLEAMENAKVLTKAEKPDLNQLSGGVSGFGKTQDEIDASLERLDADLEKITWNMNKSLDDPQYVYLRLNICGRQAKEDANHPNL